MPPVPPGKRQPTGRCQQRRQQGVLPPVPPLAPPPATCPVRTRLRHKLRRCRLWRRHRTCRHGRCCRSRPHTWPHTRTARAAARLAAALEAAAQVQGRSRWQGALVRRRRQCRHTSAPPPPSRPHQQCPPQPAPSPQPALAHAARRCGGRWRLPPGSPRALLLAPPAAPPLPVGGRHMLRWTAGRTTAATTRAACPGAAGAARGGACRGPQQTWRCCRATTAAAALPAAPWLPAWAVMLPPVWDLHRCRRQRRRHRRRLLLLPLGRPLQRGLRCLAAAVTWPTSATRRALTAVPAPAPPGLHSRCWPRAVPCGRLPPRTLRLRRPPLRPSVRMVRHTRRRARHRRYTHMRTRWYRRK